MEHDPLHTLREILRSRRVHAWGAFCGIAAAAALFLHYAVMNIGDSDFLEYLRESGMLAEDFFAIALFAIGVLLAAVALGKWLLNGRRLEERCPTEGVRLIRAPLGGVFSARFEVDGHRVTATRSGTSVLLTSPTKVKLSRKLLRSIARTPDAHPDYAASSRAASELVWAGVTSLVIERDQLVIHGGTTRVVDLVRHAIELASAPTKLGLRAHQRDHERGCPYCHQPLSDVLENPTLRCTGCDSLSHTECWKEHGGCAVFACTKSPAARGRERERPERAAPTKAKAKG